MQDVSLVVTARNGAVESENKIHDDETARRFGFRGGLVPGVTLHGHMATAAYRALGPDWVERGTLSTRFQSPVYDGEEVTVAARPRSGAEAPAVDITLVNGAGEACATGAATLPSRAAAPPDASGFGVRPVPAERPPADESSLAAGTVLAALGPGQVWASRARLFERFCVDAAGREDPREDPGLMVVDANTVLVASVRLGPWIHVGSDVVHHGALQPGEPLEVRARVAGNHERKGHQFVVLDVLWLGPTAPVMSARHTAIYRLRGA